jgi:hypothetical protein
MMQSSNIIVFLHVRQFRLSQEGLAWPSSPFTLGLQENYTFEKSCVRASLEIGKKLCLKKQR